MINHIVYLRVFAALAVVCIHVSSTVISSGNLLVEFFNKFSLWAVPIFIMISGVLILNKEISDAKDFIYKRLRRLIPAFIIWNFFYFIFFQIFSNQYSMSERLAVFSEKLYSASHLWYIPMILAIMVVAPFINWFIKGHTLTKNKLLFLCALILFDLFLYQIKLINPALEYYPFFNGFLIFFVLGYVCEKYIRVKNIMFLLIPLLILLFGGYFYELYFGKIFYFNYLSLTGCLISITVYTIFSNFVNFEPNKLFISISDASFGIYLMHLIFVTMFAKFNLITTSNFIIITILIFLLSYIFTSLLRRFKLGRLIT